MSDEKKTPTPRKSRRSAGLSAGQILTREINDLVELMARVKELSLEPQAPADLLDILEGIGRSCSRLVTMLKAEIALGEGDEIGEAVREAVRIALGDVPLINSLREREPDGETSGAQASAPGRQPDQKALEHPPAGESTATATPERPGARPAGNPAAGQNPKRMTSDETA